MAILATGVTKVSGKVADTGGEVVLSAADVGALPVSGGTLTGTLGIKNVTNSKGSVITPETEEGTGICWGNTAQWSRIYTKENILQVFDGSSISRVYHEKYKPTAADIQNVVSPVSAGGIIERGSNANGEYVKFADGTMVCWLSNFNIPETALSAGFSRMCNLPAVYASTDGMKPTASVLATNSGNLEASGALYRNGFILEVLDVSRILFNGYTYVSPIQTPLTVGVVVWGRWK